MSFETEFPELKDKLMAYDGENDTAWYLQKWLWSDDVQKNCLSKWRVREAIKKLVDAPGCGCLGIDGDDLVRELGLGDKDV